MTPLAAAASVDVAFPAYFWAYKVTWIGVPRDLELQRQTDLRLGDLMLCTSISEDGSGMKRRDFMDVASK